MYPDDPPAVGLVLPVHVEAQPLQGFGGGALLHGPLHRAVAAVHHLVDLLEAVGRLRHTTHTTHNTQTHAQVSTNKTIRAR